MRVAKERRIRRKARRARRKARIEAWWQATKTIAVEKRNIVQEILDGIRELKR